MTDVVVQDKDVVVEVEQPTVPPTATPPKIGLVEINQTIARGSIWTTGNGAPTVPGGQYGDMYLDVDTGDIYSWVAGAWQFEGTFAPATLTPAEILAALLTVDGAGSNLDADLLDGEQGAYYAKQSDMTTETTRNDTQDTQIAQNSGDIAGNAAAIATLNATKAPLASPTFTGDPKAPTAAPGDNDTSIATTAFVAAALIAGTLPADILAKLLTVDGAGSGLDADLLDGQHGAYYLPAGTYTAADILAKLLTVDGAGSGLDADLIDGHDTAYLVALANATGTLSDAQHGARGGGTLHATATASVQGFMTDAPSDSFAYGRKDGAWLKVVEAATIKTANTKNLMLNPCFNVSQENGDTEGTTNGYYAADQWLAGVVASGAAVGFGRVAANNPSGSKYRYRFRVTTIKASLAAGDYAAVLQKIEGLNFLDSAWSITGSQRDLVLRFGFNGPAGTYSVSFRNLATNYSFVKSFTISAGQAGTDTVQTIKIPAPPTTTWNTGNVGAVTVQFTFAAGTSVVAPTDNVWVASDYYAAPGQSNGLAAVQSFYLWDVGLYADPDQTVVPPPFQIPEIGDDIADVQRYFRSIKTGMRAWANAGTQYFDTMVMMTPALRNAPTITRIGGGSFVNVSSDALNAISTNEFRYEIVAQSAGDAFGIGVTWNLSARM